MKKDKWLYEISPNTKLLSLNLKEVWNYRDLVMLFVKRDVITLYKQTILGPLWYLIQPLFTSLIFTLIFNTVAGIETGNIPPFLFNLVGVTIWNYFKECLTATSDTFKKNEQIFGKVYFPRVIMPLSIIISNLLKFGIQLLILIIFYIYYVFVVGIDLLPNISLVFFPFLVICMGMIGLGLGMIISSLVTKYRDLTFLVGFGVQLLMYVSAVMYPIDLMRKKLIDLERGKDHSWVIDFNPMAQIIEAGRYMMLNEGEVSLAGMLYVAVFSFLILFSGIVIFNKTEKTFIDTI